MTAEWETQSGPWRPAEVAAILTECAYVERAGAHLRAGWVPKVPELDVKIALGLHLQQDMEHAAQLLQRAHALAAGDSKPSAVPAGFGKLMEAIDAASGTADLLVGLYQNVGQRLIGLYDKLLRETDPLADAASARLVAAILEEKRSQVEWAKGALSGWPTGTAPSEFGTRMGRLWEARRQGEPLASDQWLWLPRDRVPQAVRPPGMVRSEAGAMRLLPSQPVVDTGLFLHSFINEEFTTLELIARNTYEHPQMPMNFHRDMARHAAEEARHAQMFIAAAKAYGVNYGDYPIYTFSYDGLYQFAPCPPGSQRELLWRMLLRQTVNEGAALDSLAFEARKREYLGQPDLARLFEYVLADEVFHAASGLKWSRHLCGGDEEALLRERAAAFEYYSDTLQKRRAQWVAGHLEAAVAEVEHLEEVIQTHQFPFRMSVNLAARKQAGFTDEEIHQFPDLIGY